MKSPAVIVAATGVLVATTSPTICVEQMALANGLGLSHVEHDCVSGAALGPSTSQWLVLAGLSLLLLATTSATVRDALASRLVRLLPLTARSFTFGNVLVSTGARSVAATRRGVTCGQRGPPRAPAPDLLTT